MIPLNRPGAVNQYVVENVYNVRDLEVKIQDVDITFSVLRELHQDANVHRKQQLMAIVMQAMLNNIEQLAQVLNLGKYLPISVLILHISLESLLKQYPFRLINIHFYVLFLLGQLLEHDNRVENLNKTKILLYLFGQLVELVQWDTKVRWILSRGKAEG